MFQHDTTWTLSWHSLSSWWFNHGTCYSLSSRGSLTGPSAVSNQIKETCLSPFWNQVYIRLKHDSLCMVENLRSIINDCHNVRIIMLIVIVKRIEEHSQSCPHIRTAEDGAVVGTSLSCIPKRQTIRPYPSSAADTKYYVHLPPIEIYRLLRPYRTWTTFSISL